jgi:hypothetical protein
MCLGRWRRKRPFGGGRHTTSQRSLTISTASKLSFRPKYLMMFPGVRRGPRLRPCNPDCRARRSRQCLNSDSRHERRRRINWGLHHHRQHSPHGGSPWFRTISDKVGSRTRCDRSQWSRFSIPREQRSPPMTTGMREIQQRSRPTLWSLWWSQLYLPVHTQPCWKPKAPQVPRCSNSISSAITRPRNSQSLDARAGRSWGRRDDRRFI